uniref:Uncharacterized protein MANES_17G086800 n=1 Tax=Rhizophora mucronata TaxID=61149 RepID=A0A2P2N8M5_RHIMU
MQKQKHVSKLQVVIKHHCQLKNCREGDILHPLLFHGLHSLQQALNLALHSELHVAVIGA